MFLMGVEPGIRAMNLDEYTREFSFFFKKDLDINDSESTIPEAILNGSVKLLFGHPESFLSHKG